MNDCPDEGLLAAFVSGELEAGAAAAVEQHLADCSRCASAVAMACTGAPAGAEAIPLRPGARVDRYRILGLAGAGAVGLVYAAYDPKLDRKVALKVLRRAEPEQEERLLREARALARVTSLHVVAVHDAAVIDGRLHVAMEYVEGPTLRQWLAERPRAVPEILGAFIQAGRGLAAAHAAGIVHRDFKPDNVLIRPGGQATVTDFGLALAAAEPDGAGGETPSGDVHLTSSGTLVGTPAFMAPEQLRGLRADARSDLFAFCVALHGALHGKHPFPTASLRELSDAVQRGAIAPLRNPAVPARVRAAILAGLRPRPEDRPASMDALLARLEARPARRAVLALGAVAVLGATAVAVAARRPAVVEPPCRGAERHLAGVWDGERRDGLERALAATGSPLAAGAGRAIERALDDYAGRWTAARTDACEATRVRGEQSEAALDRRMACLDERLLRLGALVRSVEQAGAAQVAEAVVAAYGLPGVERCADPTAMGEAPPPVSPTRLPLVVLARATVARASARGSLGDRTGGLRALAPALAVARESGDRTLEAEARLAEGLMAEPAAAETSLQASAVAAQASGRWDLAARAWIQLARRFGTERAAEALRLTEYALAATERSGDTLLRADALISQAIVQTWSHHHDEGQRLFREALALVEAKVGPDGQAMVEPLNGLAWVLRITGQTAQALELVTRAAAISERTLGREHPRALNMRSQIGCALAEMGRNDEALAALTESVAVRGRVEGEDSLAVAGVLDCLAMVQLNMGANRDAAATYRRSLAIMEKAYGPEATRLVYDLGMLGRSLALEGDLAQADEVTRRGLAISETLEETHLLRAVALLHRGDVLYRAHRCREALPVAERARARFAAGGGDLDASWAMDTLGRCQRALGRPAEAEKTFLEALAIREKAYGGKHFAVADALVALSGIHHELRDDRRAVDEAARGVAILEETRYSGDLVAEARFRWAEALVALDPPRARALAQAARGELAGYAARHPVRREVDAWLAKHP